MAIGPFKAIVYLKDPLVYSDGNYTIVYCRPIVDTSSPVAGKTSAEFIDLGSDNYNLGISVNISNIKAIVYEYEDGAIDLNIGEFSDHQGVLDLT